MTDRRIGRVAVPVVLYLLCAGWIVFYLRLLVEPAPDWQAPLLAVVAIGLVAWSLGRIRQRLLRVAAVALAAVVGILLVLGTRSGAWPWREDVSGRNGYLGAGGYLDQVQELLRNAGTAWVRVVFPADGVGEPDAVLAVRLIALGLLVLCAAGLLTFRVPLLAILSVACAVVLASLFVARDHTVVQGIALCLLGVTVLCAMPDSDRRRGSRARVAVLSGGGLVVIAVALAVVPGVAPRGALNWHRWTFDQPQPVNVGFVWDQQLTALDFGKQETPVLEVNDPNVDYLRIGVLERFDGFRWQAAQRVVSTTRSATVDVPNDLLAPALRGDRAPVSTAEIRNLATLTRGLPLPAGTVSISGLAGAVRPVSLASGGSVVLAKDLPLGATYTVALADRKLTPALLDADVLGAPTDPRQAVLQELAGLKLTGRRVDPDGPGPWNADHSGTQSDRPVSPTQPAADTPVTATLSKPDPADLTVGGATYPAFGEPGREQEVQRVFRSQVIGDPSTVSPIDGWREPYRVARKLTADAKTPYQAAVILENWFQTKFSYDETATYGEVSAFGPLPVFLQSERRAAHCQYFAGSMAVLLRMLGIPARVAFGFAQGRLDGDKRVITNRDAHAWVEVRFPYAGWVSFEPTPSRRLASSTSSTSSTFNTSDIVQPGGSLAGLAGEERLPNGAGPNRGTTSSSAAALPLVADAPSPWPRRLLTLLGVLLGAIVLGVAVWLAKELRRWRARQTDDPRRGATAAHAEIAAWLDDQGIATRGATIDDVGRQATTAFAVPTERWVEAVVVARFGPPVAARASLSTARAETRRLKRVLRGSATRRDRVRGAIRPRRLLDR
jgi:transglutaminase-like putative cysteine protease